MFIHVQDLVVQTDHLSVISPMTKRAIVPGSESFEFQIALVNGDKHVFKYKTEGDAKIARQELLRAIGAAPN